MTLFSTLLSEVQACKICEDHLPFGPRPVLQLHPDARILIAGQAPGRKVHESGIPFWQIKFILNGIGKVMVYLLAKNSSASTS
jgi:hypothetical protein